MPPTLENLAAHCALPDGTPARTLSHHAAQELAAASRTSLRLVERDALLAGVIPERYLRNFKTLDHAAQARLLDCQVAMVGLGGLGGILLEGLARLGFGRIRAADHDRFESTNLNRQLLATTDSLNLPKAHAARERTALVNPAVELDIVQGHIAQGDFAAFFAGADVAIDALGGMACRLSAQQGAAAARVPLITASVAGQTAMAATVLPGLPGPADLFCPGGHLPGQGQCAEDALGCLVPAIDVAAGLVLAEAVRLALGREPRLGGPTGQMAVFDLDRVSLDRFSL